MGIRKIFISGVIQGSATDKSIFSQDYRIKIKSALSAKFPEAEIFDPFDGHENSIDYDDAKGKETFMHHIDHLKSSDLVIAYLPHASMGTSIEIWEAHINKIPVWTITPMSSNWVIRFCSRKIFRDIEDFAAFVNQLENFRIETEEDADVRI